MTRVATVASDPIQQFAIDIGNSGLRVVRLGVGQLPDHNLLRINWQLRDHSQTSLPSGDRFAPTDAAWTRQLASLIDSRASSRIWISSVNRPATETLLDYLRSLPRCEWHLINHKLLPLAIEVDFPERVGIDRLLAAIAALEEFETGSAIVIQAGSAVTVDLVAKGSPPLRSRFLGGAIVPGVPMMLRLLGQAADLLPELDADDLVGLPPLPGKNTEAAMQAGVSSCLVGGVQHLVQRYRHAAKDQLPIVLSGGDGPLLVPHLTGPIIEVPQLVLRGIGIVALRTGHET